ncbi:MAG: dGTP triphosphohydrolase, partial [Candidatus Zophobacter franzmannii]|nr:dGTP triphosphohydrolase [Candidatus Zophobacter franzmannii]
MEGRVVRIADTVSYIGQDIEDAIRCNILTRDQLPKDVTAYLGNKNSRIINTLVESVVINSFEQDYISFDEETSGYLLKLKQFNYKYIYTDPNVKQANEMIERTMNILFDKYLEDLNKGNIESKIYQHFLNHKSDSYISRFNDTEKVRDFIATMTDRYFNQEIKDYLVPWKY